MSEVEREIHKATKFKVKDYADRQDYLAAVVRAMDKLDPATFDEMSDEATQWFNDACDDMNAKDEIREFPDVEPPEDEEAETEETADDDSGDDTDGDAEEATEEAETAEDEPEESSEDEGEAAEAAEDAAKDRAKAAKLAKGTKAKPVAKAAPAKAPKPVKEVKKPPAPGTHRPGPRVVNNDLPKDKFGVVDGTKTHEAVMMFERGATSAEVNEKIEGRFYNVLSKLVKEGHKVEKLENGKIKLTHKSEIGKAATTTKKDLRKK